MKYTAKFKYEAFEYDPYGIKPKWFTDMKETGQAFEYAPSHKKDYYHACFGNKRGEYVALVGDYICRDEFGHIFVWSAKTFSQRGFID